MHLLQDEKKADDTSYLLPSLTALIQTHEPEAMTNASGTLSLLVCSVLVIFSIREFTQNLLSIVPVTDSQPNYFGIPLSYWRNLFLAGCAMLYDA